MKQLAVHVMKTMRAGTLVQVVDVLRAEIEAIAHLLFDGGQCAVRCVGLRSHRIATAHGVEAPHQLGVRLPGLGRGDLLHAMTVPKAA